MNSILSKYEEEAIDISYVSSIKIDQEMKYKKERYEEEFNINYYKQPAFLIPILIGPQDYRINNIPLFDSNGTLNEIYYGKIIEKNAEKNNEEMNEEEKKEIV